MMQVNNNCVNCGVCETECPNEAISEEGGKHIINPELCTECKGYYDKSQCIEICPQEAIRK